MSGCDWQKKSFSVAVSEEKPLGTCQECKGQIEETIYRYNGTTLCKECFGKRPSPRSNDLDFSFTTTRDKLYEFTDYKNFKTPVEVHGKRHWKSLLKQNGLVDDFDQKPKSPEDLKNHFSGWKPTDKKFVANEILKELHDKGLYHKLVKRR